MNDWEININPNGVSIKTMKTRPMIDPDTSEIVEMPTSSHRNSIGVGQFDTPELFTAHVAALMGGKYGGMIQQVVSESEIARSELVSANTALDGLQAERDTLQTARDALQVEVRAARADASNRAAALDTLKAERDSLRMQLDHFVN